MASPYLRPLFEYTWVIVVRRLPSARQNTQDYFDKCRRGKVLLGMGSLCVAHRGNATRVGWCTLVKFGAVGTIKRGLLKTLFFW